jgi:AcrR family transcriptional regulator
MSKNERGEATKTNIIETTGKLVARHGFDDVSLRTVSNESGENLGSIYYHFKSKDALFEQVALAALEDGLFGLTDTETEQLQRSDIRPEEISILVRDMIHRQVDQMFRSEKPDWHFKVIYQLMMRDGPLYQIFEQRVLATDDQEMMLFFRAMYPGISREQLIARGGIIKMALISHVNYSSMVQKRLNVDQYSDTYLQELEDVVARQMQFMLNVPVDEDNLKSRLKI